MYPVSKAFLDAVSENTRSSFWSGYIRTATGMEYPFTNQQIVKGSGSINHQCCGSNEIELGTVYAAELCISLFLDINRYTLKDGEITLFYHLGLADGSFEELPMGIYDIAEANRTVRCLELKAYDHMVRFEKDYKNLVTSGTAYELLQLACTQCGVELGPTKEEIESWPNGNIILGIYSENDMETWRDLIHYLAQVLGRFATIDRSGKLDFRTYGNEPVWKIPDKHRFTSSFSDFITRYTAVSSTNLRTKEAEYYAVEPDDGLTMNLSDNPLLQFGLKETREMLLRNILDSLEKIAYVPFDATTIGNPALDLGDILTFTGAHADESKVTCLTGYTVRINGKQSLTCVGKNPLLSRSKSKNDKNLSGLLNQIEAGKISVYTFTNAKRYQITNVETEIINIEFAAMEATDAEFHASMILEIPAQEDGGYTELELTYVVNGNVINTYYPKETLCEGSHTWTLYYPFSELKENSYNTFQVRMKALKGSAVIESMQIISTISGQGLSSGALSWDGRIKVEDMIGDVYCLGVFVKKVKDDTLVDCKLPQTTFPEDVMEKHSLAQTTVPAMMDHPPRFFLYNPNHPVNDTMTSLRISPVAAPHFTDVLSIGGIE